jgi:hypothetical protein
MVVAMEGKEKERWLKKGLLFGLKLCNLIHHFIIIFV